MKYVITTYTNGVYGSVEGKTPLSALNACGRRRNGETVKGTNAVECDDEGNRTPGYILRQGRTAEFIADKVSAAEDAVFDAARR